MNPPAKLYTLAKPQPGESRAEQMRRLAAESDAAAAQELAEIVADARALAERFDGIAANPRAFPAGIRDRAGREALHLRGEADAVEALAGRMGR